MTEKKSAIDGAFYLYEKFASNEPFASGKIGHSELVCLYNYFFYAQNNKSIEWDSGVVTQIINNAGVFPAAGDSLISFIVEYTESLKYVDCMALWSGFNPEFERNVIQTYSNNCEFIDLQSLEPFYFGAPWTKHLKGKRVLVISPFAHSIEKQYSIREKLWEDPRILPEFELKTIKHIHSPNIDKPCHYESWIDMVNHVKNQIDSIDYDVLLSGCGASSIPFASHAKKNGKIGIHLGGPLQLLFGIKGGRWDEGSIGKHFYNEYWVRPSGDEIPVNHKFIENGCYW